MSLEIDNIRPRVGTLMYRRRETGNRYGGLLITSMDRFKNTMCDILAVGKLRLADGSLIDHPEIQAGMIGHISGTCDNESVDAISYPDLFFTNFNEVHAIYEEITEEVS